MKPLRYVNFEDCQQRAEPLPWQAAGRQYTATGYGRKVPTCMKVQLPGDQRWRRVYSCRCSNASTEYVVKDGGWVVVR